MTYRLVLVINLCIIPLWFAFVACSDTDEGQGSAGCKVFVELKDNISQDTTLDGCYTVTQSINVSGATVTIAEGSTIQFEQDVRLSMTSGGVLVAKGSATKPILMTGVSKTRGYWRYLAFSGSAGPNNELDWVIVEYGGDDSYDPANVVIEDAVSISITNSTFRQSSGYGIQIDNGANVTSFATNTMTQNTAGAASVGSDSAGYLDDASDYTGNDVDQVLLTDGGNYNVRRDQTWSGINVPYLLDDGIGIQAHLTIAAGAEIRIKQDQGISVTGSVGGALTAVGTQQEPILLTGEQDTLGYWQFLRYVNSNDTNNRLEYVTVENAGEDDYQPGDLVVEDGSRIAIVNCTFRKSSGFGLYVENNAIITEFSGNTITQNAEGAVSIGSDSAGYLDDTSDYSGNDVDQVLLTDGGNYNVRRDQTWPGINVDYLLDDTILVQAHLTIGAGAVIRVKNDMQISITGSAGGALTAVGTSEKPIVFSRELSSVGNWAGIVFNNSAVANNKLEYVTVEYGGANDLADVKLVSGTVIDIQNSTFQHSAKDGIYVDCDVTVNDLEASSNTFLDNVLDINVNTSC